MDKFREKLIIIMISAAISWLLVVGLKGNVGIISGALLFTVTIVLAIIDKVPSRKEDIYSPLLASLLFIICGIYMICIGKYKPLLPVFILLALAGCEEIFFWFKSKCYEGKSWKEIVSNELRLPPLLDLFILIDMIYNIVRAELMVTPVVVVILLLLAFDFGRQLKALKDHKVSDWI